MHATADELARYRAVTGEKSSIFRSLRSLYLALRRARRYTSAVQKAYGVGPAAQLRELAKARLGVGLSTEQFYLHQYYLPERREIWRRHVDASGHLQGWLIADCGRRYSEILHDKIAFFQMAENIGLPTIPIIATFVEGIAISTAAALVGDLFSKPSTGWKGNHGELWRYEAGLYRHSKKALAFQWRELLEHLRKQSELQGRAFILQAAARNHQGLAPLTNGALATVRIVTCKAPSGSIDLMPPALKIPWGEAVADNMAQGGVVAPIDLASGRLSGPGYRKDCKVGSVRVLNHPNTGAVLNNFELPFWRETVQLARRAHAEFDSLFFIGWDIAILEGGPVILEGNPYWDPDVICLSHRVPLADTQFVSYWLRAYNPMALNPIHSALSN